MDNKQICFLSTYQNQTAEEERQHVLNFRDLSVYPTAKEISQQEPTDSSTADNLTKTYSTIDHYLDKQFRSLKEKCIFEVRYCLKNYFKMRSDKDLMHKTLQLPVREHPKTIFLRHWYQRNCTGFLVSNDKKDLYQTNYLLRGNLVCFSRDDFATCLIGRVIVRNEEMLNRSHIIVAFEDESEHDIHFHQPYDMLELCFNFEPYFYVLKALLNMPTHTFPLADYLLNPLPTRTQIPDYLRNSAILRQSPATAESKLDKSQKLAFEAALTSTFTIIQGMPGTGKTFLGIEIVRTLLRNQSTWCDGGPILIVTPTDRALNVFLSGLLSMTSEIVRIGNPLKDDDLEVFSLKNLRMQAELQDSESKRTIVSLFCAIMQINQALSDIELYDSVVDFDCFKKSRIGPFYDTTWFATSSNEDLLRWLLSNNDGVAGNVEPDVNTIEAIIIKAEDRDALKQWKNVNETFKDSFQDLLDHHDNVDDDFVSIAIEQSEFKDCCNTIISLKSLAGDIDRLETELELAIDHQQRERKQEVLKIIRAIEKYIKTEMEQGAMQAIRRKELTVDLLNPHAISSVDRWKLYFFWLDVYKTNLTEDLRRLQEDFRRKCEAYSEGRNIADLELLKTKKVVGMTMGETFERLSMLQRLKSRIVIVEEVGDIPECFITSLLTHQCEHLILFGNSLQPTYSNNYYKGVQNTILKRMRANKVKIYRLDVQHRMRPYLAELIFPNVFNNLELRSLDCNFPPVLGVKSCFYFIDHQHNEGTASGGSILNNYEVNFLICLAKYFRRNGYSPEDITFLTPNVGQLNDFRIKNDSIDCNVCCEYLNNFQGESKIVLLSLVRSNQQDVIGKLKYKNYILYALSRAKEGLYVIGNMRSLRQANKFWNQFAINLKKQNVLGPALPLRCQIDGSRTDIHKPKDFAQVPEGTCGKPCGFKLDCGHTCPLTCHIANREHIEIKCEEC